MLLWSQPLHQLANDEVEYVAVARDLLAGRGWVFYEHYHWLRAPLYPLFLAGSLWLAGGNLYLAALPNILLSVANVYLAYRLARALAGPRAAILAALLTAILWTNATFASLYMAETLFTFLFTAALVCLFEREPIRDDQHAASAEGRTSSLLPVIAAGVLFGLATLTRSMSMLFLPVVAVWLVFQQWTANDKRLALTHRLVPAVVFLCCACLTIAPWTIRNYLAYGAVIPVETGLSYNLWAFSEPREDLPTIHRTLEEISNPAERSEYATAKGMARLREDPAILVRKLWPNWIYLTRVKPIQDRFILETYYLDVGLPLFSAALVFDDLLYLVIALTAIVGLVYAKRSVDGWQPTTDDQSARADSAFVRLMRWVGAPKTLCVLWLLYAITTMLLTHGESRYRHFLFPVLIPYAAWVFARFVRPSAKHQAPRTKSKQSLTLGALVALPLSLLLLIPVLTYYPWSWAGQNFARGVYQFAGSATWAIGQRDTALGFYEQATQAHPTTHSYLRLGHAERAAGLLDRAEQSYRESWRLARLWVAPSTSLGDLLRARGDLEGARVAFEGFYADERDVLGWAWHNLSPQPTATLDIGSGLDFGYISGVYPAEQQQGATARWTNGRALLRLHSDSPNQPAMLRLRLAAPHPDDQPARATICAASRCQKLTVSRTWRVYTLVVAPPNNTPIEIRSETFDGGDERTLGVLVDWAEVRTQ